MNCIQTQMKINGFINRQLNSVELEEFLKHIKECKKCYDELETQFIFQEAVIRMDREEEVACNYDDLLEKRILEADEITRQKNGIRKVATWMGIILIVIVLLLAVKGILDLGGFF